MEPTERETREDQGTEEDERRRSSRVRRPVQRYNGINEIESGEEMLEARRRVIVKDLHTDRNSHKSHWECYFQ